MPVCLLGCFRPSKERVKDLTGFFGLLETGKRRQKDLSLSFGIVNLAGGPSEGILYPRHLCHANDALKLGNRCKGGG